MKKIVLLISLLVLFSDVFSLEAAKHKAVEELLTRSTGCFEQGNYLEALRLDLEALNLAEQLGDVSLITKCYNAAGEVFLVQKDYDKAEDYFLRALNAGKKNDGKNEMAKTLNNLGNVLEARKKYTEALPYYQQALAIYEILGSKTGIAVCSSNLGIIYSALGKDSTAVDYHFKALALDEEIGSKTGIACDALHIGDFYTKTKDYKKAEAYLLRSLALSDTVGDRLAIQTALESCSYLYAAKGKHQKALEFYQKAMRLKAQLFDEEKNKELTRMEMNFEFEKKEAAAKAEQEKKDLHALAALRRNRLIAGSLVLLAVVIFIGILQARKKDRLLFDKEKKLLTAEQQRLNSELEHSRKMLDTYTESMLRKSEMLEQFKAEINALKQLKSKELYEEKIGQLDRLNKVSILTEDDWLKFQELFEQVYAGFFIRLKEKLPGLTPAETRLMCLTKLKLSTRQMADMLGVSFDTIKKTRYRLRKKLDDRETGDLDDVLKDL